MIMKLVVIFLSGMVLASVWFGLNMLCQILGSKMKLEMVGRFSQLLAAVIPLAAILHYNEFSLLHIESLTDGRCWILMIGTVLLTSCMISYKKKGKVVAGRELIWLAVDGICMEVPQRLMMQIFMILLLSHWQLPIELSVPITAGVWCFCICVQYWMFKNKMNRDTVFEVLSSLLFSIGIGYLLVYSEFIGFTMLGHGLERVLSNQFRKGRERQLS